MLQLYCALLCLVVAEMGKLVAVSLLCLKGVAKGSNALAMSNAVRCKAVHVFICIVPKLHFSVWLLNLSRVFFPPFFF